MKIILSWALCLFTALSSSSFAQGNFDKSQDLLVCQFDNFPDNDDIQAQAAVASLLAHSDFAGVNYFCVTGAYGTQTYDPNAAYIDSRSLFSLGFGQEALPGDTAAQRAQARWVDAHDTIIYGTNANGQVVRSAARIAKMDFASDVIVEKAKPILQAGGKVWVMEAGQSDLSADWIEKLIAQGVTNTATNVIIVQHSVWNETHTAGNGWLYDDNKNDWQYVTNGQHNTYYKIDDGNSINDTPNYKNAGTTFVSEAVSASNPNTVARDIWTLAKQITDATAYVGIINEGGADFSDTVEIMWIFGLAGENEGLSNVRNFWDTYVVNGEFGINTTIQANLYSDESRPDTDSIIRDAGTKVATVRHNSWVAYHDFNFGSSGVARIDVSASSNYTTGGTIQFRLGSPTGTVISEVVVDRTAGWHDVKTFSNTPSTYVSGTHDLYLTFVGNGSSVLMHVQDFKIVADNTDVNTIIAAQDFHGESHPETTATIGVVNSVLSKITTIRDDSWVVYEDFKFGLSGVVNIDISASSSRAGGTIKLRLGSETGIVIGEVDVTNTGGWNTFETFSDIITASVTGTHDLYLTFEGTDGGVLMHVQDFIFTSGSSLGSSYYAGDFDDESHFNDDVTIALQGTNVAKIRNGSWIQFYDYNFGAGVSSIDVSAASANGTVGGSIEFRLGSPTGTLIGTVDVTPTGAWNVFADFSTNQVTSVPGIHDLYLVFTGNTNVLMKLGTFQIN